MAVCPADSQVCSVVINAPLLSLRTRFSDSQVSYLLEAGYISVSALCFSCREGQQDSQEGGVPHHDESHQNLQLPGRRLLRLKEQLLACDSGEGEFEFDFFLCELIPKRSLQG